MSMNHLVYIATFYIQGHRLLACQMVLGVFGVHKNPYSGPLSCGGNEKWALNLYGVRYWLVTHVGNTPR